MNKKTIVKISLNPLVFVVMTGLIFRLIAWHNTCIVNPDAIAYIAQAKAIYSNNYSAIFARLDFLSIYSLCVAFMFPLFSNWILTATVISLFFGTITIIPLYFFLMEYLDRQYALATTLITATLPVFVSRSADIIKDPMYWFFLTAGLYFFVHHLKVKNTKQAFVSFIFFFLATLVRIEAVVVLLISFIFFIVCSKNRKHVMGLIVLLSVIGISIAFNIEVLRAGFTKFFRFGYVINLVNGFYHNYQLLRTQIKHLALQQPLTEKLFLLDATRDMWLIGIEKVFNSFLEGVAYIPGFFCVIGILSFPMSRMDKKFTYCFALISASFCALYIFNLDTWILSYRYVILFIIPVSVFMGLGLKKCCVYAAQKCNISEITAMRILVAVVLVIALAKDLKPRRANQVMENRSQVYLSIQNNLHVNNNFIKSKKIKGWF